MKLVYLAMRKVENNEYNSMDYISIFNYFNDNKLD